MSIAVDGFFPCARADFGDGSHRLWTEKNITNIFKSFIDIDTTQKPIISNDNKYLIIGGYVFERSAGFTEGNDYYISVTGGELNCPPNTTDVLWDSSTGLEGAIGGTAQKVKFKSESIDNIDLNDD